MSGQTALLGFRLQTLAVLLESLHTANWTEIQIEPGGQDEVFDFVVEHPQGPDRVQVKSTRRSFTESEVRAIAQDIRQRAGTDGPDPTLHLIGNLGTNTTLDALRRISTETRVQIRPPTSAVGPVLTSAAAHQLETCIEAMGISSVPPAARELLVRALADRLDELATEGRSVPRSEFDAQLRTWVLAAYPALLTDTVKELELRSKDRARAAQYELKRENCLAALDLVDEYLAIRFGNGMPHSESTIEFATKVRRSHRRLLVSCDDPSIPARFIELFPTNDLERQPLVLFHDFSNAVRSELGFTPSEAQDTPDFRLLISLTQFSPTPGSENYRKILSSIDSKKS